MDPTVAQIILNDRRIAYAITDRDLNVLEISGAVSALRSDGQAMLGRSLFNVAPELVGCEDDLARMLDGQLNRIQLPWVNRDDGAGNTRYLTMVDLPHRDRSGRITGVIHLVEDVSEIGVLGQQLTQQRNELSLLRDLLHNRNDQLAAANAELHRLDDLKSAFVSIAAHELRTPLTAQLGYLEMLLDGDAGPLNSQQADYLRLVQAGARRLLHITGDLLDLTRIETGHIELALRPTDLAPLAETAGLEQAPQFEAKAQRLTLRTPHNLPQALCDPQRVLQIISNLLSNASKYTPEGGAITLTLALAAEPGYLQISVNDTGIGISAEDQAHMFERFFRSREAMRTGITGIGLGLYITRALVELHGGRVALESQPGQGSTFHVTLPMAGLAAGE